MIDHLIRFHSEAEALADAALVPYRAGDGWDLSRCIPGLQVWQPAFDVIEETENGPVTTHQYLPYWYILVSLPEIEPALRDHATCMLVADRAKANAGDPDFVIFTPVAPEDLGFYMVAPTFAGSNYPFGEV